MMKTRQLLFVSLVLGWMSTAFGGEPPALMKHSPYDFEQTIQRLKVAAEGNNFRVVREQSLDQGLVPANRESEDTRILYFCDFQMLNNALSTDKRVGIFLPCQVTVTQRGDAVYVVAPNPKAVRATFIDNSQLDPACERLQQAYRAIIEEATM